MNDVDKRLEEIFNYYSVELMDGERFLADEDMYWMYHKIQQLQQENERLKGSLKGSAVIVNIAQQDIHRYEKALKEILKEGYEEAGLHPDTGMQLDTFITKTARKALEDQS
jgi:hypothetical protein